MSAVCQDNYVLGFGRQCQSRLRYDLVDIFFQIELQEPREPECNLEEFTQELLWGKSVFS